MTPEIVELSSQPYAAITRTVTMTTVNEIADRIPEIAGWLSERNIAIAGAPFLRYLVIDMPEHLVIEAGFPTASSDGGDDVVHFGALPAGRYATVTHRGHPDGLADATAQLLAWAESNHTALDVKTDTDGEHWVCRLERYHTNPAEQSDLNKWETVVAIKVAEQ